MDLQTAMEQLYEDETLTEELGDDDAGLLMKWAEEQVAQLIATHQDDEAFERAFKALRLLIRSTNRAVGQRDYAEPEEQQAQLERIVQAAQGLGVIVASAQMADMQNRLNTLSSADAIRTVLNWVTPSVSAQAATPPGPPTPPDAPKPFETPPAQDAPPSPPEQARSLFSSLFDRLRGEADKPETNEDEGGNSSNPDRT